MKKGTRIVSLLLSVALILSLLSAVPAMADELDEIVMAIMSLGSPNMDDTQLVEDAINEITVAKANVKVKLMIISAANYSQQITLMLSGDEPLDLIYVGAADLPTYVSRHQILPLNDLLKEYGQGILEYVGDYIDAAKVGDEIYAVPTIRDLAAAYGFTCRTDLADKYGIDLSTVKGLSDLTPIFETIKNGEGEGFMPLVAANVSATLMKYVSFIDPLMDNNGVLLNGGLDDTKVVLYEETDTYRELVTLLHQWYEAGYIQPDIATAQEAYIPLTKAGKAFSWINVIKAGYEAQAGRNVGYQVKTVPLTDYLATTSQVDSITWGLCVNSRVPEAAVKFLNLMYSDPDVVTLLTWGIEGKHYVINENGNATYPEGVDLTTCGWSINQGYMMGNQFLTPVWVGDDTDLWVRMKADNDGAKKSLALGFNFDSSSVKTEVAAVANVRAEYQKLIENGVADPASGILDEYITKLKEAGIETIIAEKQAQLDAWLAGKQGLTF